MANPLTWIVLADEGRARILAWHAPGTDLEEVEGQIASGQGKRKVAAR